MTVSVNGASSFYSSQNLSDSSCQLSNQFFPPDISYWTKLHQKLAMFDYVMTELVCLIFLFSYLRQLFQIEKLLLTSTLRLTVKIFNSKFSFGTKTFFIKNFRSASLRYGTFAMYVATSYLLQLDNGNKFFGNLTVFRSISFVIGNTELQ